MTNDRSREALGRFHDFLGEKGIVAPATAQTRKVSSLKLLGILDEEEAKDVTSIDIDALVTRFSNLHGQQYNPDSILAYRSRLRSAVADFKSYLENPLSFKTRIQSRDHQSRPRKDAADHSTSQKTERVQEIVRAGPAPVMANSNVMPIPIRADLTILIHGLPHNLTPAEAKKISGVINALATAE